MTRRSVSSGGGTSTRPSARRLRLAAMLWACAPAAPAQVPAMHQGALPPSLASPAELATRLEGVLRDPALARALVGLRVEVAETGEVLFETQSEKRFTPASNTKIVTAAVALDALGPAYSWTTRLIADGPLREGTIDGNLWIVGGGDPAVTREDVRHWVDLLEEAGVGRISGDLIGDDRVYPEPRWGDGWLWDDLFAGWGAGVSGLQLSPASVRAAIIPAERVDGTAYLELREHGPPLRVSSRVRTGAPGSETRLWWVPSTLAAPVELRGWIPLDGGPVPLDVAPDDPTRYLLEVVRAQLQDRGIRLDGQVRRPADPEAPGSPGWTVSVGSEPLSAVLSEMMKESDNQMAEAILRTVGRENLGRGTPEAGLEAVEGTLARWGIEPGAYHLTDGSGLSRRNQITPAALVRILRAMWRHPQHAVFRGTLPVAGVDGTLRARMLGTPAMGNVRAKTGSLLSVRALSGYLTDGTGETLIFSLLVNGFDAPEDVAKALEDLIVEQLALYRRPVEPGWPGQREDP